MVQILGTRLAIDFVGSFELATERASFVSILASLAPKNDLIFGKGKESIAASAIFVVNY